MNLRLYDTATRSLRAFEPLEPGKASVYLCGLTVQGPPHIGHVRNWINFDILRRWLEHNGSEVTFVRNVTDIDDKIIAKAAEADEPWWALAFRNERELIAAEQSLGCLPPSYEPRATGHVPEMITLMQRLIEGGHAYVADGDVYFDVRSHPAYGSLSGQRMDEMQAAGDSVGDSRKRDPRDFALWKSAKPGEPSWPTPWGPGRPGWHLECSAMATKYLGPAFDIHGGGLDLVFPHHENELAQSAAAGDAFANYWMHNGMVTMAGEKMSKSLGNTLQVREIVNSWRPVEVRYYLGAAHYRSTIEFSKSALDEAATAYRRIENFVERALEGLSRFQPVEPPSAFVSAMNDDLGVPAALAEIHQAVREGNTALGLGDRPRVASALASVTVMTEILGINPVRWQLERSGAEPVADDMETLFDTSTALHAKRTHQVLALAAETGASRDRARRDRNYSEADRLRNLMQSIGIQVVDKPSGTEIEIEGLD